MKINNEISTAMSLAEQFASANVNAEMASVALKNVLQQYGVDATDNVAIHAALDALNRIKSRTTNNAAVKYIENANISN